MSSPENPIKKGGELRKWRERQNSLEKRDTRLFGQP